MEYRFARRVTSIAPSPTVAVSDRARQLQAAGHDIVDLGGGDPDFPTPAQASRSYAERSSRSSAARTG
jgi:aspartate/methionine/tyrosine aminotransferase